MNITAEQIQTQYARNAATLRVMLEAAKKVAPKKYRGYTVAELEKHIAVFEARAQGVK